MSGTASTKGVLHPSWQPTRASTEQETLSPEAPALNDGPALGGLCQPCFGPRGLGDGPTRGS